MSGKYVVLREDVWLTLQGLIPAKESRAVAVPLDSILSQAATHAERLLQDEEALSAWQPDPIPRSSWAAAITAYALAFSSCPESPRALRTLNGMLREALAVGLGAPVPEGLEPFDVSGRKVVVEASTLKTSESAGKNWRNRVQALERRMASIHGPVGAVLVVPRVTAVVFQGLERSLSASPHPWALLSIHNGCVDAIPEDPQLRIETFPSRLLG